MKPRPPKHFSGVPRDQTGRPINIASGVTYDVYVEWLADYLYRPSPKMPTSARLSLEAAWARISPLESEIAEWIWAHPCDDYPPDNYRPRHADILHRPELSTILSRVPNPAHRRELLHRFYEHLQSDSHK